MDELARREIFAPLHLSYTTFNPSPVLRDRIAASENGNAHERATCREMGYTESPDLRDRPIWGEAHDGNAHFLGGVAGHAGLFSTARETLLIAEQFLSSRTKLLKSETCELFRTNMTEGLEEARSFGWQLAVTEDSTAGPSMPPESFGHLGFTGTSCWIDPVHERIFILLTNRTHAHPLPFVNINSVRREFHSMVIAGLDGAQPPYAPR
jgi:CubicO group peptidase (beta-lactamase class C family)